jgi:hypothetical protein
MGGKIRGDYLQRFRVGRNGIWQGRERIVVAVIQ